MCVILLDLSPPRSVTAPAPPPIRSSASDETLQEQYSGNCPHGRSSGLGGAAPSYSSPCFTACPFGGPGNAPSILRGHLGFCKFPACMPTSSKRRVPLGSYGWRSDAGRPTSPRRHGCAANSRIQARGRPLRNPEEQWSPPLPPTLYLRNALGDFRTMGNPRQPTYRAALLRDNPLPRPPLRVSWPAKHDQACRRVLPSEYTPGQMNMDPTTLGGGTTSHAPPDDIDPPVLPSGAPALRPSSRSFESHSDSEHCPPCSHSHCGVRFGCWTQHGSPPLGNPGPAVVERQSEHATARGRAGGNPLGGATPSQRLRADSRKGPTGSG